MSTQAGKPRPDSRGHRTRAVAANGVQSVHRAFALLECMAASGGEAGVSELAAELGVALPTVHRILQTLGALGYVRQLPSRRYALGPALTRLGDHATQRLGVWAQPALVRLEASVNETANLAVLDGDRVAYMAQVPGRRQMRMFTEVGRRVHLHSTGVGKAILSQLDDVQVANLLQAGGMPQYTETTIVDLEAMRRELRRTRLRGWAVDEGEHEAGVRCFAMPVRGAVTPTAVSVSGPSSRITPDREAAIVAALRAAAAELSSVL